MRHRIWQRVFVRGASGEAGGPEDRCWLRLLFCVQPLCQGFPPKQVVVVPKVHGSSPVNPNLAPAPMP